MHTMKILMVWIAGSAAAHTFLNKYMDREMDMEQDAEAEGGQLSLNSTLTTLANSLLVSKNGKSINDVQKEMMKHMTPAEAARRLDGKLPAEVASLVKLSVGANVSKEGANSLDDGKIEKAILILNNMVVQAWVRLDIKVTECKEFEARHWGTYNQVMIDIARLSSQIAIAEGERTQALQDLAELRFQRTQVLEAKADAQRRYYLQYYSNTRLLADRDAERAVWNFIMQTTHCSTFGDTYIAAGLLQANGTGTIHSKVTQDLKSNFSSRICLDKKGMHTLVFENPEVQKKLESLMTPTTQKTFDLMFGKNPASFVQTESQPVQPPPYVPPGTTDSSGNPDPNAGPTMVLPPFGPDGRMPHTLPTEPINPFPPAGGGQWKKCWPGEPDCGLLHDTISLQWGGYRDLVDELKHEMAQNYDAFVIIMRNFNEQLRIIREAEQRANDMLADAIRRITIDTEEKNKKIQEKLELTIEYTKRMRICRTEIAEILYTFICGIKVTRDVIWRQHSGSTDVWIIDCDVTDWNPGPCTVECDDTCPVPGDDYACGGVHTLTRDIITSPRVIKIDGTIQDINTGGNGPVAGIVCPILVTQRKCNQKKCPVDCVMSAWSGWSACSKDCGGGMQSQTRSIIVYPKNGGQACPANAEERSCHTFSCDRDCLLSEWTRWTGCTMGCGGGTRYRKKTIIREIRGNGNCPLEYHWERYWEETCNNQPCIGDEICIAEQDLVMGIDASGSLKQNGFYAIQRYAAGITSRFRYKYYGKEAMRVGALEFGNGELDTAGLIAPAREIYPLAQAPEIMQANGLPDFRDPANGIKIAIEGMSWLKGFTNMPQALQLADTQFTMYGRREAHAGVLLITDGRPSLVWSTRQKVRELKEKNIVIYVAMITSSTTDKWYRLMEEFVTRPSHQNLIRIPSHMALMQDPEPYIQEAVIHFCPETLSPSRIIDINRRRKYALVFRGGYPDNTCGAWTWVGYVNTIEECYQNAVDHNMQGFAFGHGERAGGCYREALTAWDDTEWQRWMDNIADPPCGTGTWIANEFYDSYVINPNIADTPVYVTR